MASSGSRGPCDVALAVRWGVSWGICGESVASRRAGWPTYGERAGGPCIPPSVVGREGHPSVVGRQGRCPPHLLVGWQTTLKLALGLLKFILCCLQLAQQPFYGGVITDLLPMSILLQFGYGASHLLIILSQGLSLSPNPMVVSPQLYDPLFVSGPEDTLEPDGEEEG